MTEPTVETTRKCLINDLFPAKSNSRLTYTVALQHFLLGRQSYVYVLFPLQEDGKTALDIGMVAVPTQAHFLSVPFAAVLERVQFKLRVRRHRANVIKQNIGLFLWLEEIYVVVNYNIKRVVISSMCVCVKHTTLNSAICF